MGKHRSAEQIQRLLREADRDLAKGMRVGDVCRKLGVSSNTYFNWRRRQQPTEPDDALRVRELQIEVDRLKLLVADLMLDKQMLQEVAKKSGDAHPTTGGRELLDREVPDLRAASEPRAGSIPFDVSVSSAATFERGSPDSGGPSVGAAGIGVSATNAFTRGWVTSVGK